MKKILSLLAGLLITLTLFPHPWKPGHYVIIDTDGGIDDMRAITMFLASPDIRVLAVTISPGTLSTGNTYIKVKSLLNSFYHEGIPVGINNDCPYLSPEFPVALKTCWGDEEGITPEGVPDHISLIREILSVEKTEISFVCLGGLSTVCDALNKIPSFSQQVGEIIWSDGGKKDTGRFNYNIDASSSEEVIDGDIPVRSIRGFSDPPFFDPDMIKALSGIPTEYAVMTYSFFLSEPARSHHYSYTMNDEMTTLYLHYPELFQYDSLSDAFGTKAGDIGILRERTLTILAGETVDRNQIIRELPGDPSFYFDDIRPYVTEIIKRHGPDEWTSGVIANELHRHLGVYTTIGVKMGIRAREYFNTGVDEFSVLSSAGSEPPLSCMNDGLQASTGATPGHGLLTIRDDTVTAPSAEFSYLNRKIIITLKPGIAEKISSELKEFNFVYGLDSNIYWELVREKSIKYWLSMDRHNIFVIEEVY